ncbi:MAG: hypothetical protein HOP12_12000 [Candidatus Eisenbacteria bacterium]|uniref:DNA methyltransferase n=1 Tax=Eiseniibacteriota bacterium TaxID=2212470 RepID=A0A849SPQ0_UNCEI|nr:hypothetical protein [Candidatus Eisenbacteria bacterium]
MIKYLGSKRVLLPHILATVRPLPDVSSVLDLFSGTSRVAQTFKRARYRVHANDHNAYAATLARCYAGVDSRRRLASAERVISELDTLPGSAGWFTDTYCVRSRFFRPENDARIEAIRERIAWLALEPALEAVALTGLLEADDRVDSTTCVQMAYLKLWAPRAPRPCGLRVTERAIEHRSYIGHQIWIYDGKGRKVGTPNASHNREHLFLVELEPAVAARRH